jgi:hypothetical protein
MKNQWYGGMLAEDSSDEDQDTIKVISKTSKIAFSSELNLIQIKENFD